MNKTTEPDDIKIEVPEDKALNQTKANGSESGKKKRHEEDWAREALLDMAREGLVEQRRGRRWRIFFRFISVALVIWSLGILTFVVKGVDSERPSVDRPAAAVIDVTGLIAAGETASAKHLVPALRKAFETPNIKGVVLRMNTPGGSPVQSSEIYNAIMRLKEANPDIPVYAVAEDSLASGGYFIAAAADEIYANPASLIGSIGVRMDGFGFVEALDKLGIERRLLTSGDNKALADPFSPQDPEQTEYLQTLMNQLHQQFIDAVVAGRGDRIDADDATLFSGLIFTGQQSVENGLIDGIDNVRNVITERIGVEHQIDLSPRRNRLEQLLSTSMQNLGAGLMSQHSTIPEPQYLP